MTSPAETARIQARDERREDWALWGPYLSERQWGTVREDYSADGDAWTYFPHDHARSRAYRWGEDGLLGICDANQLLCFSPAFWNGADPILKERPFGVSNPQGNHGEDVKDYFYHLDNTPTHSFMRGLYKYPQAAFPYDALLAENARRSRAEPEFELVDTGTFAEGRYFDLFVEYAKAGPEDVCIRLRAINRGPDPAPLHILPTLWFRNTWAWGDPGITRPSLHLASDAHAVIVDTPALPEYHLYAETPDAWLFTDNETNSQRLYGSENATPFCKDAFHDHLIHGAAETINPAAYGTKAAAVFHRTLAPGEEWTLRLRLCRPPQPDAFADFDAIFTAREQECAAFYDDLAPGMPVDLAHVQRRALAGLLWCKKFYHYAVRRWLDGDPGLPPPPPERKQGRNSLWRELHAHDIISMPDSWEYPYFCAWDLMFQSVAFAVADPATAKRQSMILRGERYTAPSAEQPAYEWALSDANPPIGAWASWRIYSIDRAANAGRGDRAYLKRAFNKLLLSYAWWANRVDHTGDNVFEGGFLGLDNIGVFDRRYPLPDGSRIAQSDGTAWMASFCLAMLNIAVELARDEPEYEDIADKFLNDFIYLAAAVNIIGAGGFALWDDEDGFYYDVLKRPDGSHAYLKTRSIAGLTPLFAVESFDAATVQQFPLLRHRIEWFRQHRPHLLEQLHHIGHEQDGKLLFSLVPPERLRRLCERLFDESEFLSPHGIRALSRHYLDHPYTFTEGDRTETLAYSPADSPVAMFGGNSNWRGPVWMPMNYLLIESLQKFGFYFGDSFKIEFPTGSGVEKTLWEISLELERRLVAIFLRDADGRRPFNGGTDLFQTDPHWRDHLLFYEYFHGDNGAGIGASHQTGWTALVAKMARQLYTSETIA